MSPFSPAMSKIFIGRLSNRIPEREIAELFGKYGKIDRITVKNGFGFVEYMDPNDATEAVKMMDGYRLGGDRITVEVARDQRERSERDRPPNDRVTSPTEKLDRPNTGDSQPGNRIERFQEAPGQRRDVSPRSEFRKPYPPPPRRGDDRGDYQRDRGYRDYDGPAFRGERDRGNIVDVDRYRSDERHDRDYRDRPPVYRDNRYEGPRSERYPPPPPPPQPRGDYMNDRPYRDRSDFRPANRDQGPDFNRDRGSYYPQRYDRGERDGRNRYLPVYNDRGHDNDSGRDRDRRERDYSHGAQSDRPISKACHRCGSSDHFIRDCPVPPEKGFTNRRPRNDDNRSRSPSPNRRGRSPAPDNANEGARYRFRSRSPPAASKSSPYEAHSNVQNGATSPPSWSSNTGAPWGQEQANALETYSADDQTHYSPNEEASSYSEPTQQDNHVSSASEYDKEDVIAEI